MTLSQLLDKLLDIKSQLGNHDKRDFNVHVTELNNSIGLDVDLNGSVYNTYDPPGYNKWDDIAEAEVTGN
jgi:hypothetical protein